MRLIFVAKSPNFFSDFEIKTKVEIYIFRTWEGEVSREGPT
jgi:hypothetical protein